MASSVLPLRSAGMARSLSRKASLRLGVRPAGVSWAPRISRFAQTPLRLVLAPPADEPATAGAASVAPAVRRPPGLSEFAAQWLFGDDAPAVGVAVDPTASAAERPAATTTPPVPAAGKAMVEAPGTPRREIARRRLARRSGRITETPPSAAPHPRAESAGEQPAPDALSVDGLDRTGDAPAPDTPAGLRVAAQGPEPPALSRSPAAAGAPTRARGTPRFRLSPPPPARSDAATLKLARSPAAAPKPAELSLSTPAPSSETPSFESAKVTDVSRATYPADGTKPAKEAEPSGPTDLPMPAETGERSERPEPPEPAPTHLGGASAIARVEADAAQDVGEGLPPAAETAEPRREVALSQRPGESVAARVILRLPESGSQVSRPIVHVSTAPSMVIRSPLASTGATVARRAERPGPLRRLLRAIIGRNPEPAHTADPSSGEVEPAGVGERSAVSLEPTGIEPGVSGRGPGQAAGVESTSAEPSDRTMGVEHARITPVRLDASGDELGSGGPENVTSTGDPPMDLRGTGDESMSPAREAVEPMGTAPMGTEGAGHELPSAGSAGVKSMISAPGREPAGTALARSPAGSESVKSTISAPMSGTRAATVLTRSAAARSPQALRLHRRPHRPPHTIPRDHPDSGSAGLSTDVAPQTTTAERLATVEGAALARTEAGSASVTFAPPPGEAPAAGGSSATAPIEPPAADAGTILPAANAATPRGSTTTRTTAASRAQSAADFDDVYDRVVERLGRDLLAERERMGELVNDLPR
jgi:hypothetical protein